MKEDGMDRIIERHGRLIGLILIVAALVGGGIFYYTMNDPKPQESYSIKEKDTDNISSQAIENTEEIQQKEQVWDGDSVKSDFVMNENLGGCGLDEEVLEKIDQDTSGMTEKMQQYLYSEYEISDVTEAEWDGLATIDYRNKRVEFILDISASENCSIQCIYDQKEKAWGFYRL